MFTLYKTDSKPWLVNQVISFFSYILELESVIFPLFVFCCCLFCFQDGTKQRISKSHVVLKV